MMHREQGGVRNQQPLQLSVNPETFQFNYQNAFLYDESFTLSSLNNTVKNNQFLIFFIKITFRKHPGFVEPVEPVCNLSSTVWSFKPVYTTSHIQAQIQSTTFLFPVTGSARDRTTDL